MKGQEKKESSSEGPFVPQTWEFANNGGANETAPQERRHFVSRGLEVELGGVRSGLGREKARADAEEGPQGRGGRPVASSFCMFLTLHSSQQSSRLFDLLSKW